MPQRLRLYDIRLSRFPGLVGLCAEDQVGIAQYVNSAVPRLVQAKEAGDEGWWGTFAEVRFTIINPPATTVTCCPRAAYVTLPREIARIEAMTICDQTIPVHSPFYEYLTFGNGRVPKHFRHQSLPVESYTRNNAVTFVDLTNPPQFIAVYPTNPADAGFRVLIQGLDPANNTIYSQDGTNRVMGQFLVLPDITTVPFVQMGMPVNQITGIQKDITQGPIQIFQVDPTTGARVLLLTMEPSEQVASYRRYLIYPMPVNCCFGPNSNLCQGPATPQTMPTTVSASAYVKLEMIPVNADTDYTLIQNLEAIGEEMQAIRYYELDTANSASMGDAHHKKAIGLLNGELGHYLGYNDPAVGFAPFGSARLYKRRIGNLI